uniref:RING finger protein 113A n=2 Tax=Hirondellea gigas TaxID=1518452 RepID=A0A2P2I392_9CRUS
MFKKRARPSGSTDARRQRNDKESSSSSDNETKVVKRSLKRGSSNPLIQRSSKRGKLDTGGNNNSDSDSSSADDMRAGYRSKRDTSRTGPSDMGATSYNQIETEKDKDAQAVYERSLAINKETRGEADDKIYRGMNNYTQVFEKHDTAAGNAASGSVRAKGPIRAPDHIRSTVRWDYQPDLCKDFKETGFCGFGDSCKFLHDRTDYKLGWQLEVDANKKTNRFDDNSDEENYEIPSDEEHIPFKCLFCRQSFVDPVVTKCKHYYCEKCALEHFKKSRKCYVCGENTLGMFQPATDLMARLSQADDHDDSDT